MPSIVLVHNEVVKHTIHAHIHTPTHPRSMRRRHLQMKLITHPPPRPHQHRHYIANPEGIADTTIAPRTDGTAFYCIHTCLKQR